MGSAARWLRLALALVAASSAAGSAPPRSLPCSLAFDAVPIPNGIDLNNLTVVWAGHRDALCAEPPPEIYRGKIVMNFNDRGCCPSGGCERSWGSQVEWTQAGVDMLQRVGAVGWITMHGMHRSGNVEGLTNQGLAGTELALLHCLPSKFTGEAAADYNEALRQWYDHVGLNATLPAAQVVTGVRVVMETNPWALEFHSSGYYFFYRVLFPVMYLSGGLFGFKSAVDHVANNRENLYSVAFQLAVLILEGCVQITLGLVLAVGGWYSSPNIGNSTANFFSVMLTGCGFATALLSAFLWFSLRTAAVSMKRNGTEGFIQTHALKLTGLAVFVVLMDIAGGFAVAYQIPNFQMIVTALYCVALLVAAGIFFREYYHFRATITRAISLMGSSKSPSGTNTKMRRMLRNMSKYLAASAFCIFAFVASTLFLVSVVGG